MYTYQNLNYIITLLRYYNSNSSYYFANIKICFHISNIFLKSTYYLFANKIEFKNNISLLPTKPIYKKFCACGLFFCFNKVTALLIMICLQYST